MSAVNDRRAHHQVIEVQAEDIDDLGHVNNGVYLRYVEDVVRAHADRVGMSLSVLRELGAIPVVRRHVVTYHRPAHLGDRLEVSTRIVSVRGPRATRHNEVRREAAGELLAEVETEWVWVHPETGRPRPIPGTILEAFGFPPASPQPPGQ